jgi:hypothetical protein
VRQKGKTHCGCCPACLERRQAFVAAGIEERLEPYQMDVRSDPLMYSDKADYFRIYRLEASKWVRGDKDVRQRMFNHLRLTDMPLDEDERICALQLQHSREVLLAFGATP